MRKPSAGILAYSIENGQLLKVLLVHPGGPFWAKKDDAAWSIPKGEYEADEEPFAAARREFKEELGQASPEGEYLPLGESKRKDGKVITVWAIAGEIDTSKVTSNTFTVEWPPRSGRMQDFPEVDRAEWFELAKAATKLHGSQAVFLTRLAEKLGMEISSTLEK